MRIVKVSVNVSRKVSLPEYSNVSFSLGMEADIAEGEDAFVLMDTLRKDAVAYVEEQCNQALEREGQPAKFYEGELYDVVMFLDNVLVAQHGLALVSYPASYRNLYTGHRWSGAVMLAEQEAKKRGLRFAADSTLIGEIEALQAKMLTLAEESSALALFEIGRVRREDKSVFLCASIPFARVLFDNRSSLDYHLFRDQAQIADQVAHDWRNVELVEVQTVEELAALYLQDGQDVDDYDGEDDDPGM